MKSKTKKVGLYKGVPKLSDEIYNILRIERKSPLEIELWIKEWQRITLLHEKDRYKAEEYLIDVMSTLTMTFQAGHTLHNAGFTTSNRSGTKAIGLLDAHSRVNLYRREFNISLGKGAGWLGLKMAIRSDKRAKKNSATRAKTIVTMVSYLVDNFSEEDQRYAKMVFSKKPPRRLDTESLLEWAYKNS